MKMLKITVEPGIEEVRLTLEGDLAGSWVRVLEDSWRMTRSTFPGGASLIDLTSVVRVDEAGRYLLALIHEAGARMVSTGVATKDLLDSIAKDWPAARIEGPGWTAVPSPRTRRA
jgi:ABC-type transporter Mla MlaB component